MESYVEVMVLSSVKTMKKYNIPGVDRLAS